MDRLYANQRSIDKKTYQFICFALSIKGRSKPCVLKHFKGALEAGATVKELAYILALVMRELPVPMIVGLTMLSEIGRKLSQATFPVIVKNRVTDNALDKGV